MLYVIAKLITKPGKAPDVMQAALDLIEATREEPGCISYDLGSDIEDDDVLVFIERWESRDDLEDHFQMPHMVAFSAAVKALVESQQMEIVEPANVEVI